MKSGGKAWTKEGRPKVTYYLVIFLHLYFNSDLSGIFGPYFWVGREMQNCPPTTFISN